MATEQQYPAVFYLLWFLVMFFGVLTWYLKNFTQRLELLRISAISGTISMIGILVIVFF
ncbi:MAG: hypothetical protein ACPGAN_05225 [Candidatus Poseidoniaceae archaeon]